MNSILQFWRSDRIVGVVISTAAFAIACYLAADVKAPGIIDDMIRMSEQLARQVGIVDQRSMVFFSPLWLLWLGFLSEISKVSLFANSVVLKTVLFKLLGIVSLTGWGIFTWKKLILNIDRQQRPFFWWFLSLLCLTCAPLFYSAAVLGHYTSLVVAGGSCFILLLLEERRRLSGIVLGLLLSLSSLSWGLLPFAAVHLSRGEDRWRRACRVIFPTVVTLVILRVLVSSLGFSPFNSFIEAIDVAATAGEYNIYTLFGQRDLQISQTFLGIVGTYIFVSLVIGIAAFIAKKGISSLAVSRSSHLKNADVLSLGAGFSLIVTVFVPGMQSGASLMVLAFLPFINIESRRTLALFILIIVTALFELHANHRIAFSTGFLMKVWAMDPKQWVTPLSYFSCIVKVAVGVALCPRMRQDTASLDCNESRLGFLEGFWKKLNRPANFGPRESLYVLILCSLAGWLSFKNLGRDFVPHKGLPMSGTWTVKLTSDLPIKHLWFVKSHHKLRIETTCATSQKILDYVLESYWAYGWKHRELAAPCKGDLEFQFHSSDKDSRGIVYELLFADVNGHLLNIGQICGADGCSTFQNHPFFDESSHLTGAPTLADGGFYDESFNIEPGIKRMRFADETMLNARHPFFGRALIYLSMKYNGITPWAWRLPGAIAGTLTPVALFLFAFFLFRRHDLAMVAGGLSLLDCARLAASRVATVDNQLTLWVILTQLFLVLCIRYALRRTFEPEHRNSRNAFLICLTMLSTGIFFGLATATKWIGGFQIPLIAVTSTIIFRAMSRIDHPRKQHLRSLTLVTALGFCFICVPIFIYFASYLPFLVGEDLLHPLSSFTRHQMDILTTHMHISGTHAYQIPFTSWPFLDLPTRLYKGYGLPMGSVSSMFMFGNPMVWWFILPAFAVILYFRKYREEPALIYVIGAFCCQYLPWMFVNRPVFNYHFLSASIFGIVAIAYLVAEAFSRRRWVAIAYVGLVLASFLWFYPLTVAETLSREEHAQRQLFNSWFHLLD